MIFRETATGHSVADLHAILSCPQTEDQLAIRPQGVVLDVCMRRRCR